MLVRPRSGATRVGSRFLRDERAARAERQVALQPDDEIEGRHPPANGEAAADVAAEDGVDRGGNLKNVLRIEKHLDEFLRIPGVDDAQISPHRAAQQPLVAGKKPPRLLRMIEHDVEDVGALFAGEEREEDAAAENRIDETGGVAREHPARTR